MRWSPRKAAQAGLNGQGADLPGYTPGDLGQDLLDADDELLVLGGVALDGAVQPGHVEIQGAECGRFAGAWGGGDTSKEPNGGSPRKQRSVGSDGRGQGVWTWENQGQLWQRGDVTQ